MDYKAIINADLNAGFSKVELEVLIGLPKNNLSGILKGNRKLSRKSELKIEKWQKSSKPNPLDLKIEKLVKVKVTDLTKPNKEVKVKIIATTNYSIDTLPKNLNDLKDLCPKELNGFEKSDWISQNRVKYGI